MAGIMGFLRGLFGGGGGAAADAPPAAETEYKGFMIRPAPRKEASGWLTVGVIVKQFPEGAKEHHFIRADTYQSHDDVRAHWGKHLEVVETLEAAVSMQDAAVLMKSRS